MHNKGRGVSGASGSNTMPPLEHCGTCSPKIREIPVPDKSMRVLVAIASYGTRNDSYLRQLIAEYTCMPFQIDIVVVSNIQKDVPANVRLVVGLPRRNPWSLPFAHKQIFVESAERYDLFIYSEDDTLITKQHVDAFLRATVVLEPEEIAGFLRSEVGLDGTTYYSSIHSHYRWEPNSVCCRGTDTFAVFSNEHGACYMLTQDHLRRAIDSGGFDVPPHEGKYDMLVSAATDPYTQCGLKKLICISRLQDFTCKHLTNKYVGRTGLEKRLVDIQVEALLDIATRGVSVAPPVRVGTLLPGNRWNKWYYEPCRDDMLSMIPDRVRRVLSLGCGWGRTEEALVDRNVQVTAIPLDVVIGKVAETRGIRVVGEPLQAGPERLAGEEFDVMLISNLLHLVEDPVDLLRKYRAVLHAGGMAILSCPNMNQLAIWTRRVLAAKKLSGDRELRTLGRSLYLRWTGATMAQGSRIFDSADFVRA